MNKLELTVKEATELVEKGKAKYVGFLNNPMYVLHYEDKYYVKCLDKYECNLYPKRVKG